MAAPELLVLQHIACEPPAAYEDELVARGVPLARVEVDEGEPIPDWREFAGIVAMGGPMGAYEDDAYPWLAEEKRLIAEAVRSGQPYWGVCLGAQLLAASLGARVYPGERAEVGVLPVRLTEAAAAIRCSAPRPPSSAPSNGTATRSTCRTARRYSPAARPTRTRRSSGSARTRSSSTSRSRRSWPPSGRRCPRTRHRSTRSWAPARSLGWWTS